MQRHRCSRPVAIALGDGLITKETSVFDYGCGRGDDLRFLKSRRIKAAGYDPHYKPKAKRTESDVVNIGYVLNVIEDPRERLDTLRAAYKLARKVLIVSVRVDRSLEPAEEFGDGHLTRSGTFQKIYEQSEFLAYLEDALGGRPQVAGLGIAYVFKDEESEAHYLANRAFTRRLEYRTDLIEEFAKNKTAKRYVRLATKLGRAPLPEEFPAYDELLESFGTPDRVERLTMREVDRDKFEGSREQKRADIITFLAMLRLQRLAAPTLGKLDRRVQADIRAIWNSYRSAREESETFLFSIGDPDAVRQACEAAPIGKQLPDDLYVHVSAQDELPALVRLVVYAARCIVGEVECDIIKVRKDGRGVSLLRYEEFDSDAHPRLSYSLRVNLPRARYDIREYRSSPNPPILHRKDSFVAPSYPYYEKFRALTEREEEIGLLGRRDIGHVRQWNELLEECRVRIEDHDVLRR